VYLFIVHFYQATKPADYALSDPQRQQKLLSLFADESVPFDERKIQPLSTNPIIANVTEKQLYSHDPPSDRAPRKEKFSPHVRTLPRAFVSALVFSRFPLTLRI
jgi:hypothetical protein